MPHMPRLLVVDSKPFVVEDLLELRPMWLILHAETSHTALELLNNQPPDYLNLVIVRIGRLPCQLDGVMLTRLLTLHEACRGARFMVLLEAPWDERDNAASLAAGADRVLAYPETREHIVPVWFHAMRLLFGKSHPPVHAGCSLLPYSFPGA